jgi:hypothetical protein
LITNNWLPVQRLNSLSYGSVTSSLSEVDLLSFLYWLTRNGSVGSFVAFDIAFMYCFANKNAFYNFKDFYKTILTSSLLLIGDPKTTDAMHSYHVQEVVNSLLKDGNEPEFAKILASKIAEICENAKVYLVEDALRSVTVVLIDKYLESTWPIFSTAILSGKWTIRYNMARLLGAKYSFEDEGYDLLSKIPLNVLLEWMKTNNPTAAVFVARNSNLLLFNKESNTCSLTAIANQILDNFCESSEVLESIIINLVEFGWSGSAVPYYERRISALLPLKQHSNFKVRNWAEETIQKMEQMVTYEKRRNDEEFFLNH